MAEDIYMEKGICRQSIVSMRREPGHRIDMVNQMLFGEHYSVLEESQDKKWLHIESAIDHYKGWIQKEQHHVISSDFFEQIENTEYKISTDITSLILFNKSHINIVMGSILPLSGNELFKLEEQLAFNGEAKNLGDKKDWDFLKQMALKYSNAPYLWGGKSPFGIDCSGFTQMVFRLGGYFLARDASQQVHEGKPVEDLDQALPGDLVFFVDKEGSVDHVGLYSEGNKIIHASGFVKVDNLCPEGIMNSISGINTHKIHSIRRILR